MKNICQLFLSLSVFLVLFCSSIHAQEGRTITGTVHDEAGESVIGATVAIKGTANGTITNIDGRFTLNNVSNSGHISISYIGYTPIEETLSDKTEYNFILKEDILALEEVVVIGYGTARKRDLTGAISSVRADKVRNEAPRSVEDLLRANVPGLNIKMGGKAKGDGEMIIRGKGTLRDKEGTPLLVVDGVIYDGSLSDINPNDIASIDVLKDASSAAVYGAKAGYGVIVIMTRRGSDEGKPIINVSTNWGVVSMANKRKVLSPNGYIQMRQDYMVGKSSDDYLNQFPEIYSDPRTLNSVSQLDWYNYDMDKPVGSVTEQELLTKWLGGRLNLKTPELESYFAGRTTDWLDEVFHTGVQQDYSASVSNRTKDASYYWSLGWQDRESVYVGDRYTNLTSRINLESTITNFLTVGINMNFSSRDEGALTAEWGQAKNLSPFASNEMGNPESPYRLYPTGDNSSKNPFYDNAYRDRKDLTTTLNGTIYGKITLPLGFEYQMNFTPHLSWREYFNHDSSKHEDWAASGGTVERIHLKTYNWQVDNVFRWKYKFADTHSLEATFLVNSEKAQHWATKAKSSSFSPNDILGFHNIGAGTVPEVSTSFDLNDINRSDTYRTGDALMGRLFYSYKDKYMITGSVRRDGYSAFGQQNPHATFPAVAVGWVFTSESFGEKLNPWMNYGKLRFSWGENGNRDIGAYDALANLTPGLQPFIDQNGNIYLSSQLWVSRMANPGLKWEKTASYNIGLDFSILRDIISGSIEVYNKKTNDLLVTRRLPDVTGFDNVTANLGQIENKGFEVSLSANIIRKENFEWTATGNFSLNRRKLTKLYGDMVDILDANGNVIGKQEADDVQNKWFIGKDPDQLWGYERNGVWQLGEEEEAAKYGCAPGDFKYIDQNQDGLMTDDDKRFQKYKTPRFRWSLRNSFRVYKDVELSFMLYSLWGHYDTFNDAANNFFADRLSNYDYPRWTTTNPTNDFARIGSRNIGDNWVERSFIRLDNITVSYNVPKKFLSKFSMKNLRFTAAVKNVALFAPDWKNRWDPETGEPYGRTFNFGVNFTL